MSWPTTGAGSLSSGYLATGVTTIRWGSNLLVTSVNTVSTSVTVGIVTRFHQRSLVDNIKLPNGDGLTITRVQIIDGVQWDVNIRDDTGLTGSGTVGRPVPGSTVVIVDGLGLLGAAGTTYNATVVETAYETAPRQAGEFTITVENLTLITE